MTSLPFLVTFDALGKCYFIYLIEKTDGIFILRSMKVMSASLEVV